MIFRVRRREKYVDGITCYKMKMVARRLDGPPLGFYGST